MKRSLDSDSTDSSSGGGGGSSSKKRASTIHKIGVENSQTLAAYLEVIVELVSFYGMTSGRRLVVC